MAKKTDAQKQAEKELAFEEVKEALDSAADALLDDGEDSEFQEFESEPRRMSFKTLLKKYADGELVIPPYQRRFVWNPKKQKEFYETVEEAIPTPSFMLAEWNGILSLMDGFQRFTTLSIMSNSPKFTKEQQKKVRDYKIDTITILNMPPLKQRKCFQKFNSGILVSGVIKQRANLSEAMEALVTKIVADEFPEDMNLDIKFNKSAHHDTIVENALLSAADIKLDGNRPEILAKLLNENEEVVLKNQDKAIEIIKRIINLYQNDISETITKRSLNANFVSILVRIITNHPETDTTNIIKVINYIFANHKAVAEYGETTGNGSGDASKCQARYDLIMELLKNPPEIDIDEKEYKTFLKQHKDTDIYDSTGEHAVFIKKLSDDDLRDLYTAKRDGNQSQFDKIIVEKSKFKNS